MRQSGGTRFPGVAEGKICFSPGSWFLADLLVGKRVCLGWAIKIFLFVHVLALFQHILYIYFNIYIQLYMCVCVCVCVLIAQSYPILCDPMDCSLPGSSVHGILQARILESVAILFSKGSSQPRDWTQVSCIAGRFFTIWATREAHICIIYTYIIYICLGKPMCVYTQTFVCVYMHIYIYIYIHTP